MRSYGWLTVAFLAGVAFLSFSLPAAVDADGDEYQIILSGPGDIVSENLNNIILANTTRRSAFVLRVLHTAGDGLVNVANLTTNGNDIGRIRIAGDLGSLFVGELDLLEVNSIGAIPESSSLALGSHSAAIRVYRGIFNAEMTVSGAVAAFHVGLADAPAAVISNSDLTLQGNAAVVRIEQSLTNDSTLTINGSAASVYIGKSIADSTLQADGSIALLNIRRGVNSGSVIRVNDSVVSLQLAKPVRDSEIEIGNRLTACRADAFSGSSLKANNLDYLTVVNSLSDTGINIANNSVLILAGDIDGLTLRVGGNLGTLQSRRDLANSLVSAYTAIGRVLVARELERSTIMAGIDIGPDLTRNPADLVKGNCLINQVIVSGDLIDSNIVAGIDAVGPEYQYGDGNDVPIDGDMGVSRITSVIVGGGIRSNRLSEETYTISAADGVQTVLSRGRPFAGIPGISVNEL